MELTKEQQVLGELCSMAESQDQKLLTLVNALYDVASDLGSKISLLKTRVELLEEQLK